MEAFDPTVGEAKAAAASTSGPEQALAELTRCLTDAYTARARIRLDRSEYDPALADLNDAVRLAPDNTEALQLRDAVEQRRGHVDRAELILGQAEQLKPAINGGRPVQTRFQAGYRVMARYSVEDDGTDDHLTHFPLTAKGRRDAIEYARHMCGEESKSQREQLYDANWTGGEQFDTVVIEHRSLSREVHLEKAVDDDGTPVID